MLPEPEIMLFWNVLMAEYKEMTSLELFQDSMLSGQSEENMHSPVKAA